MDGTDFGALVADYENAPPIEKWLPRALAHIVCVLGGGSKRIDQVMEGWGIKTETAGVKNEDVAFLAALQK